MKERFLVTIVILILAVGCAAGALFFLDGQDTWSPRNYVPAPGKCFVPPQGDPLYDEHYSGINQANCSALVDQADALYTEAETDRYKWETGAGVLGVYGIFATVALMLLVIVVAIIQQGGRGV